MNEIEYAGNSFENAPWKITETEDVELEPVTQERNSEPQTEKENTPTEQKSTQEEPETKEDGTILLDRKDIAAFTRRISGKNEDGSNKVVISYQTYAMEDDENSPDKERVYNTTKPYIELSIDTNYPQFYVLDIIYRSYDDPELKMLWGRLQRFKKNMAMEMEKTWIFYFNILETSTLTSQTAERDTLLITNVFNPTLFYLTREVPNMLTPDVHSDNELIGGNVIRMLVPVELVTFQVTNEIDTSEIKGEIMRERDAREYIDNPETHSTWEE